MMEYDIDNILKKLSNKVNESEIYIDTTKSTEITLSNDKINYAKEEEITGIGIRVINNQKQGFAYTTNTNKIDDVIEQAIKNSKLNSVDENLSLTPSGQKYRKISEIYDKRLTQINLEDTIKSCNQMNELVKENGCETIAGEYEVSISKTTIANSNGVNVTESQTYASASIEVNTEDNEGFSSAYAYDSGHQNNLNLKKIVDEASNLAKKSTNAQPTYTRDTQVVLDYFAATSLLSTFFSALNSENVQRSRSYFKDKLGQEVASDSFSLTDDGTMPGALCSSMFDDEATPSQKTELIKDGQLNSFIYDNYHARKDEQEITSTANAVRASYSSVPTVGFSNIKLDFKETCPIVDLKEAITVHNVMGAHTANPITGDFSVEVRNGFEIKNGEITTPIKKAMISGNIFKIMEEAKAIDNQTRQIGSCITPKILISNLRVIA